MTAATASKETVAPKRTRRPDLHVVPSDDIERMGDQIIAEAKHMRPAITRESLARQKLIGERAEFESTRSALLEKQALIHSLVETYDAAIADEVADLNATLALFSGVSGRQPMTSDD